MELSLPVQPPMDIAGWPEARMIEEAVWSLETATSHVAPSWCFSRYVIMSVLTLSRPPPMEPRLWVPVPDVAFVPPGMPPEGGLPLGLVPAASEPDVAPARAD